MHESGYIEQNIDGACLRRHGRDGCVIRDIECAHGDPVRVSDLRQLVGVDVRGDDFRALRGECQSRGAADTLRRSA